MNISISGNNITQCEGNMSTVYQDGIIFGGCNKDYIRVSAVMTNNI
jgi:hypothetical protein